MLIEFFEAIFGCIHRKTTWPQGPETHPTVKCLGCGKEFHYDWIAMKRGAQVNQIETRDGAVQGPILDSGATKL